MCKMLVTTFTFVFCFLIKIELCYWSKVCVFLAFQQDKIKHVNFRIRKGLLIRKVSSKMEALVIPQIHLYKLQISGFFYANERENGGTCC